MNKYLKFFLKTIWYLFIAYVIMQMIVLIIAGFFIPELGANLLMTTVGLVLGFMMGYFKGAERC